MSKAFLQKRQAKKNASFLKTQETKRKPLTKNNQRKNNRPVGQYSSGSYHPDKKHKKHKKHKKTKGELLKKRKTNLSTAQQTSACC